MLETAETVSTNIPIVIISVAFTALSLAVTIVTTLGGFAYRTLNNRITEVKTDGRQELRDEERRRTDAIVGITNHVNTQYAELRIEIHGLREDIKGQ